MNEIFFFVQEILSLFEMKRIEKHSYEEIPCFLHSNLDVRDPLNLKISISFKNYSI